LYQERQRMLAEDADQKEADAQSLYLQYTARVNDRPGRCWVGADQPVLGCGHTPRAPPRCTRWSAACCRRTPSQAGRTHYRHVYGRFRTLRDTPAHRGLPCQIGRSTRAPRDARAGVAGEIWTGSTQARRPRHMAV
jgi:hypothetical protein